MSVEQEQHEHDPTVLGLAAVALLGALLQIFAVVALGLAEVQSLEIAAAESPRIYMAAFLLVALALTGAWALRSRPAFSIPLLLGWPVPLWLGFRGRATGLGLAYHGELILYHFVAFIAAALTIAVTAQWAVKDDRLRARAGPLRWLPLALATAAAGCLLIAHLSSHPTLRLDGAPSIGAIGTALLLLSWPAGLALVWRHAEPDGGRIAALLLMLPVLVRVLGARSDPFNGGVVHPSWVMPLGVTIVAVSGLVAGLVRPQLERWLHAIIAFVCMFATAFCWALYHYGFGALEDGLDGLIRSFLGFSLPYPAYAADWKVLGMMLAFFFILATIYANLVSTRDRPRGLALALAACAGLGLSSPHLVLLLGSGMLLFVDTMRCRPPASTSARAGGVDVLDLEELLERLAERLALDEPILTEALVSLQGTVTGTRIDIRGRRRGAVWQVELTAGHPGRGRPRVELVPDPGEAGTRPAHLLARTHRIVGEARELESVGDRPLDALTAFPTARVRLWDGGATVELGTNLSGMDEDRLEALVRAFASI